MRSNVMFGLVMLLFLSCQQQRNENRPHLFQKGDIKQLYVNNQPYLIIGGQVHNSASGNLVYFDSVAHKLSKMFVNTIFAPVSWELLEPSEGQFEYWQIDGMVKIARKYNLKLVVLWFGSWKNGVTQYAPEWVKSDTKRFPYAIDSKGKRLTALSTCGENSKNADKKAFSNLMKHIKTIDDKENTIIMVQVENEMGLFHSRDFSQEAQKEFASNVPSTLMDYLQANKASLYYGIDSMWCMNGYRTNGNWVQVFGNSKNTDELFMAWKYASYVNEIASAGKKEYNLPMYVNAWLAFGDPGQYPSGGPVHKVIDIWKATATAIDICSPDIYGNNFKDVCDQFHRPDNPLMIPETHADVWFTPAAGDLHQSARNCFWAYAHHNAIGFSPFGLEGKPTDDPIAQSFKLISQLKPLILEFQGSGKMEGILQYKENQTNEKQLEGIMQVKKEENNCDIKFGNYIAHVSYQNTSPDDRSYGLIINTAPKEFIIAGSGLLVTFSGVDSTLSVGLSEVWEQVYKNGNWENGRRLNGDETSQGSAAQIPFCSFDKFDNASKLRVLKVKVYETH